MGRRGVKAGAVRGKYKTIRTHKDKNVPPKSELTDDDLFMLLPISERKRRKEQENQPEKEELETIPAEEVTEVKKGGRPRGSRNRSTVVREILQLANWGRNPLTGMQEKLSQEYRITLAILAKALKGDVNAYKALMDNAYKPHAQEIETKIQTIDLSEFSTEELKGFLNDEYIESEQLERDEQQRLTYGSEEGFGDASESNIIEE
jgi:hypothetical protein